MKVGCLGKIVFEVSEKTILTIQNATWSGSVNITEHKRHLGDACTEFVGRNADMMDLEIHLSAWLGVNPLKTIRQIWDYERSGTAVPLVIGEHAYGKYRWLIQSHSIKLEKYDRAGNLLSATVQIKLIEYTRR